jgi:hypothetical protein
MHKKPGDVEYPRAAAPEPSGAEHTSASQEREPAPADELRGIITIAASMHAKELRVEEAVCRVEQGDVKVHRVGVPSTGAEPFVTYKDVTESIEIDARPPRRT